MQNADVESGTVYNIAQALFTTVYVLQVLYMCVSRYGACLWVGILFLVAQENVAANCCSLWHEYNYMCIFMQALYSTA